MSNVRCPIVGNHQPHTWFSDPQKKCPGYGYVGGDECEATYEGNRCIRDKGHDEQGLMHVNSKGDGWPAHVPAPGGKAIEEPVMDQRDRLTHYGRLVVGVAEGDGFTTEIAGVKIAKCDTYGLTYEERWMKAKIARLESELSTLKDALGDRVVDDYSRTLKTDPTGRPDPTLCTWIGCNKPREHDGKHGVTL